MPPVHLSRYAPQHTDQETACLTEAKANLGRSAGFPYSVGFTFQSLVPWRHLLATCWKSLLNEERKLSIRRSFIDSLPQKLFCAPTMCQSSHLTIFLPLRRLSGQSLFL